MDLQALEISKAPSGTDGKKMTAAARNEWVQLTFDSDVFNEMARDDFVTDLRERILKEAHSVSAAKKVANLEGSEGLAAIRRGRG